MLNTMPLLIFSPGCGSVTWRIGWARCGRLIVNDTCFDHQPLLGECTYTLSVTLPGCSAPAGTVASNPEAAQKGLPRACATSGRCEPTTLATASSLPPSPMRPWYT